MAFTAKLVDKNRDGTRINLFVEFADSETGWSTTEELSFARGDELVIADIMAQVNEVGGRYKAAIARDKALDQHIGSEVVL